MHDIAIIGLGPAGALLARLLSGRFNVIAIDRKQDRPGGFEKPCGGLLAPDAQRSLSKLGMTLPKDVLVDPQIFAVRTIDTKQGICRTYQRFYMNLDRHLFDRWLIAQIPLRVKVMDDAVCLNVRREQEGGYAVTVAKSGGRETIRAKMVVGADGANSLVRRKLFPDKPISRYLSIQQWFQAAKQRPFYACFFDSDVTDSYCWSLSKNEFVLLGGAFPVKDANARFALLKERAALNGVQLGVAVKTEACLVNMPKGPKDFCPGRGGAFLIGEAAGFLSPSSLEGISYALDSARALADALNAGTADPFSLYMKKTRALRAKLCLKCLKAPFLTTPFLRRLAMESGLQSIAVTEGSDGP